MKYYDKFKAKIGYQTKSGMKGTVECESPQGLLDEAVMYSYREKGEEYVRQIVETTLARARAVDAQIAKDKK